MTIEYSPPVDWGYGHGCSLTIKAEEGQSERIEEFKIDFEGNSTTRTYFKPTDAQGYFNRQPGKWELWRKV